MTKNLLTHGSWFNTPSTNLIGKTLLPYNFFPYSVFLSFLFGELYEGLNEVNRQMAKNLTVNRQKQYFYRQPWNEQAIISRQISLIKN